MAQNIRDNLEIATNVRMKDMENAQPHIVDIIRDLAVFQFEPLSTS